MPRGRSNNPKGGTNLPVKGVSKGFQPLDAPVTEEEQHQVARWLGEFHAPLRIPDLFKERFGKVISQEYAYSFQKRQKWQGLIDRYRQEWLVKVAEVPAANQKYRLEKIQDLIRRLDLALEQKSVPGMRYESRMLRLLNQARLEMEEAQQNNNFYFTNINSQMSDEELLQRRADLLKRVQEWKAALPVRKRVSTIPATIEEADVQTSVPTDGTGEIVSSGDT